MRPRVLLAILDGFGMRSEKQGNAILHAKTPVLDHLFQTSPWTTLSTSGESVGLPPGQMGNSEVGHMNIGAGRIVFQMLTRIDRSIHDGSFFTNPALKGAISKGGTLHLLGLVSDGGVHSSLNHLEALLEMAQDEGLRGEEVQIHAITDGRDTSPTAGKGFLERVEKVCSTLKVGRIATVLGRYYAMDRDRRWDRTKRAYEAIVLRRGPTFSSALEAISSSYESGVTDEFVVPSVIEGGKAPKDNDPFVVFNFRPDRVRQIVRSLGEEEFSSFERERWPRVRIVTMTRYEETWTYPHAFVEERPDSTLGEVFSREGLAQLRIAETEKYAHVTYFFNGGREVEFPGERRILVPSPKVPTYDLKPQMSAPEIADALVRELRKGDLSLVVLNFANCDMVGHTGNFSAAVRAVEEVDRALGRVLQGALEMGFESFVTADHGNAELMLLPDGQVHTAHTLNPVPFIHAGGSHRKERLEPGILADVAPTILESCGLPIPPQMTGRPLQRRN